MTKADVYRKYKRGYQEVSFEEWLEIARAFDGGQMLSPGGVAARYGVTRQAVLYAAKQGRLYYFVGSKPFRDRGYVLIPIEGLDGVFHKCA